MSKLDWGHMLLSAVGVESSIASSLISCVEISSRLHDSLFDSCNVQYVGRVLTTSYKPTSILVYLLTSVGINQGEISHNYCD